MTDMTGMTLEERRETLVNSLRSSKGWMTDYAKAFVDQYAIDAHLVGMGEPVAWRADWQDWRQYHDRDDNPLPNSWESPPPTVTPLYLAPPASGDWDAVRDVIAALEEDGDKLGCAAMLRAALPENTK